MDESTWTLTLTVQVEDAAALHRAATREAFARNMVLEPARRDLLGDASFPDVSGCLLLLARPTDDFPGCEIVGDSARRSALRDAR